MKCFIEFHRWGDRDERERWVWEGAREELRDRMFEYVHGTGLAVRQIWLMPDDFPHVGLLNQNQYEAARECMEPDGNLL